jgi:hypothetical protein
MTCEHIQMPGSVTAIACSSGRRPKCSGCGKPARLLCDWKTKTGRYGTCDAPVCESCTVKPDKGKDLCPTHAAEYERWCAERADREIMKGIDHGST